MRQMSSTRLPSGAGITPSSCAVLEPTAAPFRVAVIPVGSPGRDGTYGNQRLLAAPVFRTGYPCDAASVPKSFCLNPYASPDEYRPRSGVPERSEPSRQHPTDDLEKYPSTSGRCAFDDSQRAPRLGSVFRVVAHIR